MSFGVENKVVIIAGMSSGLGEAVAQRFAEEGARLVLSDPTSDVEAMAGRINQTHPATASIGVRADFCDAEACDVLVAAAMKHHGGVDVLIIPSVTLQHAGPLTSIAPDEWDRVMAVNVKGPFLLCRSAIPHLARPGGAIVFVASFTGQVGAPGRCAYSTSKGALNALTRSLALELAGDGIRVNAVAPGYIWSTLDQQGLEALAATSGKTVDELRATRNATIPLGRQADIREVADAMLYIASPAASYVTGACLDVNGGLVVR
jgi:NAD(P)-dependent dehydrogenase (short-subunit alcohol dehydrogenase family)